MMLCDHCDANHHIYCLRPPLSKVNLYSGWRNNFTFYVRTSTQHYMSYYVLY